MTVCRFANLVLFFFGMTAEFTDQLMIGFIKTLPDGVFMCTGLTTDLTDTVRIKYTCAIHCMSTHGTGSLVNPHAAFGSLGCIGIQMGFFFYNAAACTTDFFMGRIISGIMISGTAFCLFFVDISTEDTYGTCLLYTSDAADEL